MPYFDGCPDEAAKYHDAYVNFWEKAIKYIYATISMSFEIVEPEKQLSLIKELKKIEPPEKFNINNNETHGKSHAFHEAFTAVKKYIVDNITQKRCLPSLDDILLNVKAKPIYGCG